MIERVIQSYIESWTMTISIIVYVRVIVLEVLAGISTTRFRMLGIDRACGSDGKARLGCRPCRHPAAQPDGVPLGLLRDETEKNQFCVDCISHRHSDLMKLYRHLSFMTVCTSHRNARMC